MKAGREMIVAVVIGFCLGFATAAGIFFLPKFSSRPKVSDVAEIIRGETATPTTERILTISDPRDQQTTNKQELTIRGKTLPRAVVVVATDLSEDVVLGDKDGNFSVTATLPLGPADVYVSAYADSTRQETSKRTVYVVSEGENQ